MANQKRIEFFNVRLSNINMKFKVIYLLTVICIACNQANTSKSKTGEALYKDSLLIEVKAGVKGDFAIYEHDLSMYNEKYLLRILPTIDSKTNKYETYIVLTKNTGTIFNKRINIDSLGQAILKHKIFADSAEHTKIASDYELRKVVYHGVRTNDIYFVADLAPLKGSKRLQVLFQVSYLYKGEIGKLFVNGFYEKWQGSNAGEKINERNRKIASPYTE